ncbi:hypothetical protein [Halorussus litoreus]|uniref:hypothetical protein n=1 Tax=Halorussus litoreus TaxID=1710536 RepID=UPI000E25B03A|nr:hypothetical protein [Halorussus litoreus]
MDQFHCSRTVLALVLVLSLFSGCLQPFGGDDPSETELGSYLLTAEKESVAPTPDRVIDFEELTPRQQNTFERAMNGSYPSARVPTGVDHEVWVEHEYVRYRNETYSVSVAVP